MSDLREFFARFEAAPTFVDRPVPIPGDSRIAYRLALLCMILRRGRANQLALEHVHVLWWASRTAQSQQVLLQRFEGLPDPDDFVVRFDPSLSVTVDLAIGQSLASMSGSGAVRLTPTGVSLADETIRDNLALETERAFLERLPANITKAAIDAALELN